MGGYLLFVADPPHRRAIASIYGIGLALTFDEFGMWLHLGGFYWQRASFDAVIVLAALLGLAAFAPRASAWRPRDVRTGVLVATAVVAFYLLLAESFRFTAEAVPRLEQLERRGPP